MIYFSLQASQVLLPFGTLIVAAVIYVDSLAYIMNVSMFQMVTRRFKRLYYKVRHAYSVLPRVTLGFNKNVKL